MIGFVNTGAKSKIYNAFIMEFFMETEEKIDKLKNKNNDILAKFFVIFLFCICFLSFIAIQPIILFLYLLILIFYLPKLIFNVLYDLEQIIMELSIYIFNKIKILLDTLKYGFFYFYKCDICKQKNFFKIHKHDINALSKKDYENLLNKTIICDRCKKKINLLCLNEKKRISNAKIYNMFELNMKNGNYNLHNKIDKNNTEEEPQEILSCSIVEDNKKEEQ